VAQPPEREPGRLSRERIVEAVFRLLDRDGWEALSMRRLAQELDVWPMAVYRYFRDKDELVDALVAHVIQEVDLPSARGPWRAQLRRLLEVVRRALERLPPELHGRLAVALLAPDTPRLSDAGLEILESAGFGEDDGRRAWVALTAYAVGFVEIAPAIPDDARFDDGLDDLLDGLERGLQAADAAAARRAPRPRARAESPRRAGGGPPRRARSR
jgi:TetR/AcrR family tetracycline transcriptional repressor